MEQKRYIVHDFCIGNPVLIDRANNSMTFYNHNIYGQLYNLKKAEPHVIDTKKMNGLIRRLNNPNYSYLTGKVVDGYIYTYLMTPEQKAGCRSKPSIPGWDEMIAATDDYAEAITKMCEWVYEHEYCKQLGGKETERGKLLEYCKDYLSQYQSDNIQSEAGKETPERKITHKSVER